MSDARARAEKRRSKILAREGRAVTAVISELETEAAESDKAILERPLASRRNYVESIKSDDKLDKLDTSVNSVTDSVDEIDKDNINSKEKLNNNEDFSDNLNEASKSEKSKKIDFGSKKSMKEIEEEIAKNTAEFDKKTVSKNDKKEEKEDDKDSKKDDKIILKKKVLLKPTLKPANITKFVRVLVVIAMATFTAYKFIEISTIVSDLSMEGKMYDEFSSLNGIEAPIQDASWVGWFQKKLIAQFECTISAIGIIYWIAGAFAQIWIAKLPPAKQEKGSFLNVIMSFFQNGLDGILEPVYSLIGDLNLYIVALIIVGSTMSMIRDMSAVGNSSGAPAENNEL